MSILFGHNDELRDGAMGHEDMGLRDRHVGDLLTYWALIFASASITVLGFWKLVDLIM